MAQRDLLEGMQSFWVEQFIENVRTRKHIAMALGSAAGGGQLVMVALKEDPTLEGEFRTLLDAVDFSARDDLRASLVEFARTLGQTDGVLLCEWLGVPLMERGGVPVEKHEDAVAHADDVVSADVLPEVLDGVLSLPRTHWEAAMGAGTFKGVRPGASSSVSSGFVNVVSWDQAAEIANERTGEGVYSQDTLVETQKVLSEGVAHEIGHTMDNAMPSAHAALCGALGFQAFGPSEAKAFLTAAGVGWEADAEVAAKVVELWLLKEEWGQAGADAWKGALLAEAHKAVHGAGTPDADSFAQSSLFSLLTTSQDPTSVDKTEHGGAGLSLFARAKEAQVWGPTMFTHLKAWNNGKAALSDREYCAELYRVAMTADDQEQAVAGYPTAARTWLTQVQKL